MSEAPDIREQEDCPSGDACDWSCDQHEGSTPADDTGDGLGSHDHSGPVEGCTECGAALLRITKAVTEQPKISQLEAENNRLAAGLKQFMTTVDELQAERDEWREAAVIHESQRDEARAEVDSLRAEVERLRDDLARCPKGIEGHLCCDCNPVEDAWDEGFTRGYMFRHVNPGTETHGPDARPGLAENPYRLAVAPVSLADVREAREAYGVAVVEAFVKHMWELHDKFGDDSPDEYLSGFIRAIEEIDVNLHYYVDGRLPRSEEVNPHG